MTGKLLGLFISGLLCAGATAAMQAQTQMSVTIDTTAQGQAIPSDFSGLGFERGTESFGNAGASGYLFSPQNTQLVTLFQNLSIKNLRIGGGSVDDESVAGAGSDGFAGVDDLFQFAQAAGVKVIYSLRLLNPAARRNIPNLLSEDVAVAQHIAQNFSPELASFSIGNEPDFHSYHTYCTKIGCICIYPSGCTGTSSNLHINDPLIYETVIAVNNTTAGTAYPSYLADWRNFESAVVGGVPGQTLKFSGPDTGAYSTLTDYNGESWTQHLAEDESGSGMFANATQHVYVGGSPGATTAQQAIDNMLSAQWVTGSEIAANPEGTGTYTPYPWLYSNNLAPILAGGLSYRLTESNDYLTGINGASNRFVSALWALDYMHWWAEHGAAGVNFHNKQWIYTDTIVPDPNPCVGVCGNYQAAPKGYGIKAFDLGGHGYAENVTINNPGKANVTAYAVKAARDIYLTIINKTHTTTNDATTASITVVPEGIPASSVASMTLTDGSPGDPSLQATALGGATIDNNSRWLGLWIPLAPETNGQLAVSVPPSTAIVVKIHGASAYAGPVQINQNGTLEAFAIDSSGNLWRDQQVSPSGSGPGNWSGWTNDLTGMIARGAPVVTRNLDNTLEIFAPGSNGDVYNNFQATPGGAWSGWTDMGASSHGVNNLVATSNADGSLIVFGVGPNGDLWYSSESAPEVGWSTWADLIGEQIQPGFAVAQDLSGLLEVFGLGPDGQLWRNAQVNTSTWSGWQAMQNPTSGVGGLTSIQDLNARGKAPSHLAAGRNLDGTVEVFELGPDSRLRYIAQQTPGEAWGSWTTLEGHLVRPGFTVGQDATGRLVVFADGLSNGTPNGLAGGGIWSIAQETPGGAFGQWTYLGGTGLSPQLTVSNTADGRIQIFTINGDHDVVSNWQTSVGSGSGWSGWTDFGGNNLNFYSGQSEQK